MTLSTKQREWVENLQDEVWKGHYDHKDGVRELEKLCEAQGVDVYEDLVFPIEHNTCDRCGAVENSESLYWVDYFDENEDKEAKILSNMESDYCALCEECCKDLQRDNYWFVSFSETETKELLGLMGRWRNDTGISDRLYNKLCKTEIKLNAKGE